MPFQEAFAVIRDAMSREKVDGLGRVVLSSRERPMLVAVMGNGLCGVTLRSRMRCGSKQNIST